MQLTYIKFNNNSSFIITTHESHSSFNRELQLMDGYDMLKIRQRTEPYQCTQNYTHVFKSTIPDFVVIER